jgi:hypothetical protein
LKTGLVTWIFTALDPTTAEQNSPCLLRLIGYHRSDGATARPFPSGSSEQGAVMRTFLLLGCTVAATLMLAGPARPADNKLATDDPSDLSLEVTALQMMHQLQITQSQLEALVKIAGTTAMEAPAHREVKIGAKLRKALLDLRDALLEGDDDRIAELNATLEELREKEKPEFDDFIEITDAARKQVAEFLRRLSARQVALYVSDFAEEFPDPREQLAEGFDVARTQTGKDWQDLRDEVAEQVAGLVAGLDPVAEGKVKEQVVALLNRVHRLKPEEYKAQRQELDKAAQQIIGKAGPTDFMRHFVERTVAELLSNPRLPTVAEARLKQMKKKD